ncbi:MAG: hypothetical protein NTY69_02945 [Methylococcales bacterium]|nr:hypothetical protein [Methylococcales bacterium]
MPLFILINLLLCLFAQDNNNFKEILLMPSLTYLCLGVAIISFCAVLVKKWRIFIWYDLFASSIVLIWFSYWQPDFNSDAPMYFYYPLYFAMVTALITLQLERAQQKIDPVSFSVMQSLASRAVIQPWAIMIVIFISLELKQNFLFFPTVMTLFVIRFALVNYLSKHVR